MEKNMKSALQLRLSKICLCGLCILCALCVSCKGDYDDWAQPQHNDPVVPAEVTMSVDVAAPASVIELEELADADEVQVFVPVKVESNVAVQYYLTLSDDLGNSRDLVVTEEGYVAKQDLVNLILDFYGKKQVLHPLDARLTAEYTHNGSTMKAQSEAFVVNILPAVPDLNYWVYGKQNNLDGEHKTLPLMPVTKEIQTVTTRFSGSIDAKIWSDDTFGEGVPLGAEGGTNVKAMTGTFKDGGGYICPTSAGWYTLTLNFASYTYTFTPLENQEPTEYAAIHLIGDFNQWNVDADVTMTQVAARGNAWNSHCWYALDVPMTAGGVKFRANDNWDVNWGTDQKVQDEPYGTGVQDGQNIVVPTGKYNVYFNDITGEFLFIEQ